MDCIEKYRVLTYYALVGRS